MHDTAVKGYLELSFTFFGNLTATSEINGSVAVSDVFQFACGESGWPEFY